ncbi:hypothetical protein FSP39_000437 [Pinctada imbricata]|uniref:HTH CENPB-type domain-containing protein n=1 Tax=Pinctada imbricata TaxID=66713 RepID=A0AA89C2Y2_PINIB|nr:hypothetical protein FSP39_000437 [Pinctada imbricata]
MEDFESNMPGNSKRKRRKTGNEEVNELTWAWFKEAMTRRVNVNGPLIQQRALEFAKDLGNETFKASNGWLISFLKRNNIVLGTMSGERGDVDNNVVKEWIDKVPSLCAGYESCNIFNMDETGLFYRDTTRQTYHIKGDECAGGKRSKERVTLALCASLTGEKLPPLFIGKSKKPRCFNSIKPESLPVIYKNNKKAWMNSALFEEWLRALDKKMKQQKRKIILFLDNAPCHPKLSLQNVKLQFSPQIRHVKCSLWIKGSYRH